MEKDAFAKLDGDKIRFLLNEMGKELSARGELVEIALYGGAALLLMFEDRPMTKDVDFNLIEGHLGDLMDVAQAVGDRFSLPSEWFNDAVQFFLSGNQELVSYGDFPIVGPTGLRVFTASPEYLLSMKMMAMRNPLESHDLKDIWYLVQSCGVTTMEESKALFRKFFPGEEISERNERLLEEIIADQQSGEDYHPMNYW